MKKIGALAVIVASVCAAPAFASPHHKNHAPSHISAHQTVQVGKASWYGRWHAGRRTANGQRFDPQAMTCAHPTLPLGTIVKVTDIETGKNVDLEVNDRGPYVRGRIVDLSEGAARELGFEHRGLAIVRIEVIGAAPEVQRG